ncbi:HAD-like domain-containing protein [Zygosaccharomyces rouxii]|nr:HAD-like domain-containing protein [Zygosaccharomyces rouxii]
MNNVIIADFDETVTNRDTTCIVGQLPYTLDPKLKPAWSHFVDVYYEHYKKFQSNINSRVLPLLPLGKETVITDTNFTQLFHAEVDFQTSKRLLELSSTTEIESRNVFKGVKHEQVRSFVENNLQGADSLLRPGFSNFISLVPKDNFHVVSVNWSPEFIRHVIGDEKIHPHHIACNNLISDGDEYTGQFTNDLLTGSDKIKVIQQILSYYDSKESDHCLWYVGDSDTDLLSVLFPNINGVLLIDPIKESKKFQKLTVQLLGLPQKEMDEFAHDSSLGCQIVE